MRARAFLAGDVEGCARDVGEPDVDEHARGAEARAVQVGDGGREVLLLGLGEEDCVVDFVVGHCIFCSRSGVLAGGEV